MKPASFSHSLWASALLSCVFLLIALRSQESKAEGVSAKETGGPLSRGKEIYEKNCVACHGMQGDGRGPAAVAIRDTKPRDFTSGVFKYGSSDEQIYATITTGVKGTAMPPWNTLSETDRRAVVQYVLKFKISKQ